MRLENSGGDVLARGGSRAQFHGANVSQEKWDAIWEPENGSSDAVLAPPGTGGSSVTVHIPDAGK